MQNVHSNCFFPTWAEATWNKQVDAKVNLKIFYLNYSNVYSTHSWSTFSEEKTCQLTFALSSYQKTNKQFFCITWPQSKFSLVYLQSIYENNKIRALAFVWLYKKRDFSL